MKRISVYANPDDLEKVARALGCRPSETVRRMNGSFSLATEIEEVLRMPGSAPDQVFRQGPDYELPEIPEGAEIEPVA